MFIYLENILIYSKILEEQVTYDRCVLELPLMIIYCRVPT